MSRSVLQARWVAVGQVGWETTSVATRHEQMGRDAATPTAVRRASGAFAADGSLVAMTYVEVDGADAETDFTVVHPMHRGRGIGTALGAWSVLALQREGVRRFRTGGSAENVAIQRANAVLGYVQDEEWVTLAPPDSIEAATSAPGENRSHEEEPCRTRTPPADQRRAPRLLHNLNRTQQRLDDRSVSGRCQPR